MSKKRVWRYFYTVKIPLKPDHRRWNYGIVRVGPENCCLCEMGGHELQNHSLQTRPGLQPSALSGCLSRLISVYFVFLCVHICVSWDSGLCSSSTATHEEYVRHYCQICLQTPVFCSSATVDLKDIKLFQERGFKGVMNHMKVSYVMATLCFVYTLLIIKQNNDTSFFPISFERRWNVGTNTRLSMIGS